MKPTTLLLLQLALMPLPWALRRHLLNALPGFNLAAGCRIGFSLVLARQVALAPGARIGHMNVVKGLDRLELDEQASIGRGNWISAYPKGAGAHFAHLPDRRPQLVLHAHSALTNRHIVDCTDSVTLGAFCTFGGFRSQVLTHSINVEMGRQHCMPIEFGAYSFVGTGVIVLGGARLPDYSVLGAGAVLSRAFEQTHTLYAGNPAVARKQIPAEAAYFSRPRGFVV